MSRGRRAAWASMTRRSRSQTRAIFFSAIHTIGWVMKKKEGSSRRRYDLSRVVSWRVGKAPVSCSARGCDAIATHRPTRSILRCDGSRHGGHRRRQLADGPQDVSPTLLTPPHSGPHIFPGGEASFDPAGTRGPIGAKGDIQMTTMLTSHGPLTRGISTRAAARLPARRGES